MTKWLRVAAALVLAALGGLAAASAARASAPAAQQAAREIVVLEATGPVVPPLAGYISRGLDAADARNAEAVILVLNTPGGSVNTMFEIVQTIRTSDVPVVVFVGPRGAMAGSAGLLVTLAGHAAAMAPDTAIGASSPVLSTGEQMDSTLREKEEQYLSAQARSLAERRGEEATRIASEAVTEARAVSASEASSAGLVDFIAEDVDDLLRKLDGFEVEVAGRTRALATQGATLFPVPMNQFERILIILTNPNLVFLLLSIGVTAIIVEIRTPGGWVAGAIGVTCLGLALYGLGVLPVNWLGIVFVIMAFILFILEVTTPTFGALTAAGVISLAVGAFVLFSQPGIEPFGQLSIPLVVGQSLLIGGLFAFLLTMALRAQARRPTTGYQGLVGEVGRVTQALNPVGMVQVFGERWVAESVDRKPIPYGSEVEIVEAGKMRLRVRLKEMDGEGAEGKSRL